MRTVEINANVWSQKSLYIITTLSDEQIVTVLRPIIDIKRDEGESFSNDILIEMLQFRYPMEYVKLINKIDKLIF
jgi:hypothetical protein